MLIAQISDFHLKPEGILAYEVADTSTSLKQAVAHINRFKPRPDVVLITGDLVDEGATESYQILKNIIDVLKSPYFIVPGNHDHKPTLHATFPEHSYLKGNTKRALGSYMCYTVEDFPVRLIGLDTVTPGEHGGGLTSERLSWLDRTLAAKSDAPTVIFMHHPPFASGIGHMDQELFHGREEFFDIIKNNHQVERILCGHIHRSIYRRFAGTVAAVCPGIGMQLVLNLRENAPSEFILEPPSMMLHLYTDLWGEKVLLTHLSIIEGCPKQYGGTHPFFDVVSPQ
jgi:Icc protein